MQLPVMQRKMKLLTLTAAESAAESFMNALIAGFLLSWQNHAK
jgi:hypothetical protein